MLHLEFFVCKAYKMEASVNQGTTSGGNDNRNPGYLLKDMFDAQGIQAGKIKASRGSISSTRPNEPLLWE